MPLKGQHQQAGTHRQESQVSRRTFLSTAAIAGAAAAGAGRVRRARAAQGVLGANERVVMGIIGSGGMGRHHMERFKAAGVEWAAVCDVYEPNREKGLAIAGSKAEGYNEHERLLERKDIDAVLIASPEHWHCQHLIDTVQAGKDAYCEKPMCHSIKEGVKMIEAVRKTDRIVQIGMQRRSSPIIYEMKEKVFDSGVLGKIHLVRAEWYWKVGVDRSPDLPGKLDWKRFCGPAGKQEFAAIKFRHWRYFWPFSGGNETDQGTHLMDVVQWMMGVNQPLSATQIGEVYENKPTETPDTFCCTFRYPDFVATWTLCYNTNTFHNDWSICFQGDKASLWLTDNGYVVFSEVRNWSKGPLNAAMENLSGGVTDTVPHIKNFLECIKSRKEPNAPVEIGHAAVRPLHLANAALKAKREVELDEDGVTLHNDGKLF